MLFMLINAIYACVCVVSHSTEAKRHDVFMSLCNKSSSMFHHILSTQLRGLTRINFKLLLSCQQIDQTRTCNQLEYLEGACKSVQQKRRTTAAEICHNKCINRCTFTNNMLLIYKQLNSSIDKHNFALHFQLLKS